MCLLYVMYTLYNNARHSSTVVSAVYAIATNLPQGIAAHGREGGVWHCRLHCPQRTLSAGTCNIANVQSPTTGTVYQCFYTYTDKRSKRNEVMLVLFTDN